MFSFCFFVPPPGLPREDMWHNQEVFLPHQQWEKMPGRPRTSLIPQEKIMKLNLPRIFRGNDGPLKKSGSYKTLRLQILTQIRREL